MARVLWKGAISFGLVHIPVALYPATRDDKLDFDWLDKRSMQPVGYKRVNKVTGREVSKDNIVRGIEHGDGKYVVISDAEIAAAYPKATQTIDIECFVEAGEIPFVFLEKPYCLAPLARGEKVYALLREALLEAGRIGVARVVISRKQHLAALIPAGRALMLNTLRWAGEIRALKDIELPPEGQQAAGLKERELQMARQLIDDMSGHWKPDSFHDNFREQILKLVEKKAKAGRAKAVEKVEAPAEEAASTSNVVDLTELLKQSLKGKPAVKAPSHAGGGKASARSSAKSAADSSAAQRGKGTARSTPKRKRA